MIPPTEDTLKAMVRLTNDSQDFAKVLDWIKENAEDASKRTIVTPNPVDNLHRQDLGEARALFYVKAQIDGALNKLRTMGANVKVDHKVSAV